MTKAEKIFIPLYIALFIFGFWYVDKIFQQESILEYKKQKEEVVYEKILNLDLVVEYGGTQTVHRAKILNTKSVLDLLEEVRDEEKFLYEIIKYIDSVEIDYVNRIYAPEGYSWRVFENDEDITPDISSRELLDKATYTVKLVKNK